MSSNEELEIPDFDHDLSDSECESMKENDKMHKIESPTKKGTTGSPHIVRFHFVRFILCATFGNSTSLCAEKNSTK